MPVRPGVGGRLSKPSIEVEVVSKLSQMSMTMNAKSC